jgi:hypothetical protein
MNILSAILMALGLTAMLYGLGFVVYSAYCGHRYGWFSAQLYKWNGWGWILVITGYVMGMTGVAFL